MWGRGDAGTRGRGDAEMGKVREMGEIGKVTLPLSHPQTLPLSHPQTLPPSHSSSFEFQHQGLTAATCQVPSGWRVYW
jgi:hypothetical protein